MADVKVDVTFPHRELDELGQPTDKWHQPGETLTVSEERAGQLYADGFAREHETPAKREKG